MNQYRFTPQQHKGMQHMIKDIHFDYKHHDVDFRKSTLLDWLKFLMKMKDRKTYSESNKTKLNEIREYIMRKETFRRYMYIPHP